MTTLIFTSNRIGMDTPVKTRDLMFRKTITICFIFCLGLFAGTVSAQQVFQKDLSKVQVEELSDEEIRAFLSQLESSGVGQERWEQVAASRGMNPTEIGALKLRIENIQRQNPEPLKKVNSTRQVSGLDVSDATAENKQAKASRLSEAEQLLRSKIFGAELFANRNLTFEPNLRLATPVNYQLGPDDELLIDIYGYSEASYALKISPEGTINIPLVGLVQVSGATIEQASARIRNKLADIYHGIETGKTSVNVSLGDIRSIHVILTGEIVQPGTYTLPSVATVFNALYASGGPTINGSFRTVQVIRGGDVIGVLDVYDFLLYGNLTDNIRLRDQDILRIPVYRKRVEVSGGVKRPGIFEMLPGETLQDLLRFSGDFTENAYTARVKVLKNTPTQREIEDITKDHYHEYQPSSGDHFFVQEILDRFTNRVVIEGAVFRPGAYELDSYMTLRQLIEKADGLRPDALPNRGYVIRTKDDISYEMISFNTEEILAGRQTDIPLMREDIITIPSLRELQEDYFVTINGEVRNPGVFPYAEGLTLESLIIQAGGWKEGASTRRIEVARRIKSVSGNDDIARTARIFEVDVDKDLATGAGGFILQPFDIVSIRQEPGYGEQKTIKIVGEVLFPGEYALTKKDERISDLIRRAGGLTPMAYPAGASLERPETGQSEQQRKKEELRLQQLRELQSISTDSVEIDLANPVLRNDFVGIDLPRILANPGERVDLILQDGDVLNIPKLLQTVTVSGEVLSPSSVIFQPAKSFRQYISESGGFSSAALKSRAYILYANGSVAGTKKFLFFKNYPEVKPGAEIFIPKKEPKKEGMSTSEVVAITTGLATIATLVFTVLR